MQLLINGTTYNNFSRFELNLAFDTIASTFSVDVYFNPNLSAHRSLMRPLSDQEVLINYNGRRLLTGTAVNISFKQESTKQLAKLGGYSLPGVLENAYVQVPNEGCDLQFNNLSLEDITDTLIRPYGLSFGTQTPVADEAKKLYSQTEMKATQSIKEYLSQLASQRGIILSHDVSGNLIYTRPIVSNQVPVARFDGTVPGVSMTATYNSQNMHSEITVLGQADINGGDAGQATVTNALISQYKSKVVEQNSGSDTDTMQAAKMIRADELKNLKLTIEIDRWEYDGILFEPNQIIEVRNPEVYLFNPVKWFITNVNFRQDAQQRTCTLTCVLPQCYSLKDPVNIFA